MLSLAANRLTACSSINDKQKWAIMFKQKRPFEVMRILLLTNAHSINTFALKCSQVLEKLTAAVRAFGLRDSFGIDVKLPPHLRSRIIKYDLLQPDHVKLVQDLIASPYCIFVHFAPPCGTSSRARLIQRKGRFNPPIVRTDRHPDGLPGLTGVLHTRVQAANKLYAITCSLVEFLHCPKDILLHRKSRQILHVVYQTIC